MRAMGRSAFSGGIVILLLVVAVILGYITDLALTGLDKLRYPTDFSDTVMTCAQEYGIDPYIIYATIKVLSRFSSNHVSDDGKIGLMQLSKDTFLYLTQEHLHENLDAGLLYEPNTNIRYGCYYLLYLSNRYGSWEAVFTAYLCGTEQADRWYAEWQSIADSTVEFTIPDKEVQRKVKKIQRSVEKYQKLYQKAEGDVLS